MEIITVNSWQGLFNFFRSEFPGFDELDAAERVLGIFATLKHFEEHDPSFSEGLDLQVLACCLALLSKYGKQPSHNDIEGVLGVVFPEHPSLLKRRAKRARQIDALLSHESDNVSTSDALDWEAELSNLHV